MQWINTIARVYKDGRIKILKKLDNLEYPPRQIDTPLFNDSIQEIIRQDKVVARCNTSIKDGMIGRYWKLMTRN